MGADPNDLQRFVAAREAHVARIEAELSAGRKTSHWMWFAFPQIRGLGRSAMASAYAIASFDVARAYWAHPVLGERLARWTRIVLGSEGRGARHIFGSPDDLEFRSSMTLFELVAPAEPAFAAALDTLFDGERDLLTLAALQAAGQA